MDLNLQSIFLGCTTKNDIVLISIEDSVLNISYLLVLYNSIYLR